MKKRCNFYDYAKLFREVIKIKEKDIETLKSELVILNSLKCNNRKLLLKKQNHY